MAGKRIAAVVVAVALVAGALILRRTVIDSDDDAGADAPVATTMLVCIPELADVCRSVSEQHPDLTITVEDAGATLDRLAALGEDAEAPAWVTIEPYPAMVDALRTSGGRTALAPETTGLGAAQAAIALPPGGRADVLTAQCAPEPLWRCIGDAAGAPWTAIGGDAAWGTVRPSLGDVDASASGLASFAVAVGGYVGRPDYGAADFQSSPSFIPWLRQLAGAVGEGALSGGTPLATMVTRPSALDVAATDDAELAATGGGYDVRYPEPSMWLEAVLAAPGGRAIGADVLADLTAATAAAGWSEPAAATQPLPGASTMLALRSLWTEAT